MRTDLQDDKRICKPQIRFLRQFNLRFTPIKF
jgi:hypothetical protein